MQSVAVLGTVFGCLDDNLLIKLYVGKYDTGNGYGNRFHQKEPM